MTVNSDLCEKGGVSPCQDDGHCEMLLLQQKLIWHRNYIRYVNKNKHHSGHRTLRHQMY